MQLNIIAKIADEFWLKIKTLHTNIELDEYIFMPNHIDGIIIIEEEDENNSSAAVNKIFKRVGDVKFAFTTDITKMQLSKLIQQFERAVTIEIKKSDIYFQMAGIFL